MNTFLRKRKLMNRRLMMTVTDRVSPPPVNHDHGLRTMEEKIIVCKLVTLSKTRRTGETKIELEN